MTSSAYGPDEAFRALGDHGYLAIALALATAFTVFIISYAYSRIIEHFPFGGGGYVVATKLLGRQFGVVSGSALLVDYVLTISVSIASGADQVFSVLPARLHPYRMTAIVLAIVILMILNPRGVKESVTVLMPIFLSFLFSRPSLPQAIRTPIGPREGLHRADGAPWLLGNWPRGRPRRTFGL